MLKILLTTVMTSLFFASAQAGLLLEPYLGYQSVDSTVTLGTGVPGFNDQKIKTGNSGSTYGLRLGYANMMFFVAADYTGSKMSGTVKSAPTGLTVTATDSTGTSLGLTVGANLWLVKPYFGYIFDDKQKTDTSTTSGTGMKVGMAFSIIPKLKLGLEYYLMTYTKSETGGVTTSFGPSQAYKSMDASGYGVILSAPFTF